MRSRCTHFSLKQLSFLLNEYFNVNKLTFFEDILYSNDQGSWIIGTYPNFLLLLFYTANQSEKVFFMLKYWITVPYSWTQDWGLFESIHVSALSLLSQHTPLPWIGGRRRNNLTFPLAIITVVYARMSFQEAGFEPALTRTFDPFFLTRPLLPGYYRFANFLNFVNIIVNTVLEMNKFLFAYNAKIA